MIVINPIMGGKKLPALTNPATAAQILKGYQAIDGEGQAMTGIMEQGLREVSGTITFASSYGSLTTVTIGFRPVWVLISGRFVYIDDPEYGEKAILSGYYNPTSGTGNFVSGRTGSSGFSSSVSGYNVIKNITNAGFSLRTFDNMWGGRTVSYVVVGQ